MKRDITEKQRAFTTAYYTIGSDTHGNGRESARIANYKGKDNMLDVIASRLLRHDKVIKLKEKILAESKAETKVNAQFITGELLKLVATGNGADKNRALDMLGKHIDYYNLDNKSSIEQPSELTAEQIDQIRQAASVATSVRLSKGA